jgi:uncharacterized protein DUF3631
MLLEAMRDGARILDGAGRAHQDGHAANGAVSHAAAVTRPDVSRMPPMDGAAILDEARAFLARFWAPPTDAALDLMVLWAAHSHVTDKDGVLAFYSTPRLAFVSNEPGSGKTAGMELTGLLCPRFELVTDPTAPAMLEMIAQRRTTFGVDEIDLLFGNGMGAKAVRNVINSGYRRGASIPRVKGPQDCFAPVMLAGLASSYMGNATLAPTRSRSIIIHCRKPAAGMKPVRYREQLHAQLGRLCGDSIGEWVAQNVTEIVTAWPELPEWLDGRQEDVWGPLAAVADRAGGTWPQRFRAACTEFTQGASDGDLSLPPRLRMIADIRAVWAGDVAEMTLTALARLVRPLPGAPWSMWSELQLAVEIPGLLGLPPVRVDGAQGLTLAMVLPLFAELPEPQEEAVS